MTNREACCREQADRKLQDQRLEATHLAASQAAPGTMIAGRYKLIEAIGEGGMGSVWLAEQQEPVRRKVAIKLIKAGMDSKSRAGPVRSRTPGPGHDGSSQHRQGL